MMLQENGIFPRLLKIKIWINVNTKIFLKEQLLYNLLSQCPPIFYICLSYFLQTFATISNISAIWYILCWIVWPLLEIGLEQWKWFTILLLFQIDTYMYMYNSYWDIRFRKLALKYVNNGKMNKKCIPSFENKL